MTKEELRITFTKNVKSQVVNSIAREASIDASVFKSLVELSGDADDTARKKSSWTLAKACEMNKEALQAFIPEVLKMSKSEKIQGVLRELIKSMYNSTIPEIFAGELIEICFIQLHKLQTDLAVKYVSKNVLEKYCKVYPDLKNELIETLKKVQMAHTEAWNRYIHKTILRLEKSKLRPSQ